MRIIVSDTSCLIELRDGGLLEAFLGLPHDLVIPARLISGELLSFGAAEMAALRRAMSVVHLDPAGQLRAETLAREYPALSLYDCTAFVCAEERPGCVLLTGDKRLRNLAEAGGVEVHGSLWAVDECSRHGTAAGEALLRALVIWRDDPLRRMPREPLTRRIRKFAGG